MPDDLTTAIDKAVEETPPVTEIAPPAPLEVLKAAVTPPAEVSEPEKVEETKVEETVTEKTEPEGPSQEEINQALGLFRALQDPEAGPEVARVIAAKLGILPKPEEVRTEKPKAPTSKDILNHYLGEEYAFLGEKLAPALDSYIQAQLAPIQQQITQTQVKNEFDRSYTELDKETKGDFKKHENEVIRLMDRIKPADGVPIKDYLTDLYTLAKASRSTQAVSKEAAKAVVDKIKQNSQERLPAPSAASELRLVKGPAQPTLSESIAAALRGERFGA